MRKTLFWIAVSAVCLCSCAKNAIENSNEATKRYFDAWIRSNYPDAQKTYPGIYIVEDIPGTGELIGDPVDSLFIEADYTITALDGQYASYTYADIAKQLGEYNKTKCYGPQLMTFGNGGTYAGPEYAFKTMRVGGSRKIVIPGWLFTLNRYDKEEDYIKNVTGTNYIYDVHMTARIPDEPKWEVDSIGRYIGRLYGKSVSDSLKYGFYYIRTKEPKDTTSYKADSTFYINYIGRRLDGQVFDTTIKDTAIMNGVYRSGADYKPVKITYANSYTDIKMSGNSVIDGFAYALYQMKPYESCTAIFYSALGYSSSGSGDMIPQFSPLRFDISIVDSQ